MLIASGMGGDHIGNREDDTCLDIVAEDMIVTDRIHSPMSGCSTHHSTTVAQCYRRNWQEKKHVL